MSDTAIPITHVALRTSDIEASIAFYQRYAKLHLVHDRTDDGVRVVWLCHHREARDFVIVILELPHEIQTEPAPMDHLGFALESREEVDRIDRMAREDGIHKLGPVDGGAIVGYFVMVHDPSGNTCEFSFGQDI